MKIREISMRHGFVVRTALLLLTRQLDARLGTRSAGVGRALRLSLLLGCLLATSAGLAFAQQNAGDWSVVGDLVAARSSHTATVLNDGRVLIAGGETSSGALNEAEIFDPQTGTIRTTAHTMSVARKKHTAVILKDGRVLLVGGENSSGASSSAEIYDPNSDTFTPVGSMHSARRYHTATLINDQTVVIIGGEDTNGTANSSIERYQVSTGEFTVASARLEAPRAQHSATALLDGRIFIAGGRNNATALDSTSFYDPTADTLTDGPKLDTPRYAHTATRALYGDVVLAGGTQDGKYGYDTVAVLYRDGTMGVAANKLSVARFAHVTLELVDSGNLLVLGGRNDSGPVAAVDYMDPESFRFRAALNLLAPRSEFVAFSGNGRSCVAGGNSASGPQSSIESAQYPSLKSDRQDYLPNSQVILTGSGWLPRETVALNVRQSDGDADINLVTTADDQGNISNSELFTKNDAHVAFLVKAVGQNSNRTAYTKFTDLGATITLDPDHAPASNNPFTLKIMGVGFTLGQNTVYFQGNNLGSGTTVSDTEIDVTVPGGMASLQGSYSVIVSQLYTYTTSCCTQQCYSCNPYCCGTWCMSTCWNTCCNNVCNPCQQQSTYNTSPATFSVTDPLVPPTISKAFGAAYVRQGGTTSLSFTLTNPNPSNALTAIAFIDSLPPGLLVAAPNNLNNSCGGLAIAPVGSPMVNVSGVTLAQGSSCNISVDVTGTAVGVMNNVTAPITSAEGGTGGVASASVTVVMPPSISIAFGASTVTRNTVTTLTFSISNPNTVPINVSFTDTLPPNLVMAVPTGVVNNCGGTVSNSLPLPATTLSFSNPALPAGNCTISVNVQSAYDNNYNNSVTINSTDAGNGNTATAGLTVIDPPAITKLFSNATVPLGGTTKLTFHIDNNNVNLPLNGVSFTDSLPAGLVVATPSNSLDGCSGTLTAAPGSSSISYSNNFAPTLGCAVYVDVKATTAGVKNNSVQVSSTNGGTGNTSNASVTVVVPPTISTSFGAPSIQINGSTTSLSFTINNPNATTALTGISFSDTLPAGLSPNGQSGTCGGGTITVTENVISLSGASVAANASCTFSTNVTGMAAGTQNNTTGNVTSTEGGTGGSASASITVTPANPTILFSPAPSPASPSTVNTSATFTAALGGVSLTPVTPKGNFSFEADGRAINGCTTVPVNAAGVAACTTASLPASTYNISATYSADDNYLAAAPGSVSYTVNALHPTVAVVTNPNVSSAVNTNVTFRATLSGVPFVPIVPSGTFAFAANGTTISGCATQAMMASGADYVATCTTSSLPAGTYTVTATYAGDTNYAAASGSANYTITALHPTVTITSLPASPQQLNRPVTFTAALTGVSLTPMQPSGKFSFAANGTTISDCATMPASAAGVATCTTASLRAGVNTITATYSADPNYVADAPGSAPYTVTALDPTVTLVAAPVGSSMVNSAATFTATLTGVTLTPVQPSGTFSFVDSRSGTTIPGCSAMPVTAAGVATCLTSSLSAGPRTITATYSADPNYMATAPGSASYTITALTPTVVVADAPAGASAVNSNVTFTATLSGVAFTPIAPSGTVAFAVNGTTISTCAAQTVTVMGANAVATCTISSLPARSYEVTATYGGDPNYLASASASRDHTVTALIPTLTLAAVPASSSPVNSSVTFTASMTGVTLTPVTPSGTFTFAANGTTISGCAALAVTTAGVATCSTASLPAGTHNITATYSADPNYVAAVPGSTSYTVVAPPIIAEAFNPALIAQNATSSLTVTITNPAANTVALTGVAFTDTLPTGLTVANSAATVCGGTLNTTGPTGIALSGATIAANSQCQFTVTVTGAASGQYTSTTSSVSSTNGGTGNTATTNLTVASPPSISNVFGESQIPLNTSTSLTFNITNPNTGVALTGLAFTDNMPAGLVVASTPNLNSTCGGNLTAVSDSGSVSLVGGTLPVSASCTVSVSVTGTTAGVKNNSVQVTSAEGGTGNTSNANIGVVAPPVVIQAFGAASIPLNGSSSLSFTINNPNDSYALNGLSFSDTLPAGLVISTPNGLSGSCGAGTITATAGTNVVGLSGGATNPAGSCSFSVNVTGISAGQQNNTTGNVTSTEGGTGGTSSASIAVVAPPSIAEAFSPTHIPRNATTSLTFTITNPAANTTALTGVAFTNTLPSGLTVANSSASVCGGTLTTTAPATVAFSGATISTNSQCQFSVTVTGAVSGSYVNTTSNVTSTNGGTGNSASANLAVAMPPTITNAFGAAHIPLNGVTTLTFTIANPNGGIALTGINFTDDLPAGVEIAPIPNLSNACGGTASAVAGSESLSISGATLEANATCTVSVDVQGTTAGIKNNTTGAVSATESGPGNASNTVSLTVVAPPEISAAFGAANIPLGGATSLSFSITNPNPGNNLTGVAFTNALPTGLVVSTPNGLTSSCGGTITAVSAANSLGLAGATLAAGGSCTLSVNVTGIHAGAQVNSTGTVTSVDGGTGATATANLTVDQASTTTTVVSAGTRHFGEAAKFTATVSSTVGTPSGTVSFLDGTTTLGTAALHSGVATLSNSSLTLGTHSITAQYQGDSDYVASVSAAVNQEVISPLVTISAQSNSLTVRAGQTGVMQLTISSAGTLSGPVISTCSGLPAGAQCVFSPASASEASLPAAVTLTVITTRLRIIGQNGHSRLPFAFAMLLPGVCLLPLAGKRGKRRWLSIALGLALLLTLILVGCGGSPNSAITNVPQSTTPGTYTITVTGTSAGSTQGSMSFNLTVTP